MALIEVSKGINALCPGDEVKDNPILLVVHPYYLYGGVEGIEFHEAVYKETPEFAKKLEGFMRRNLGPIITLEEYRYSPSGRPVFEDTIQRYTTHVRGFGLYFIKTSPRASNPINTSWQGVNDFLRSFYNKEVLAVGGCYTKEGERPGCLNNALANLKDLNIKVVESLTFN